MKYARFYGKEAKTITWVTFFASMAAIVYCTLLAIKKLGDPVERQRHLRETSESKCFICLHCCEPFLGKRTENTLWCAKCAGTVMEALSGFFKRHPEKKTQCPSRYSSNKDVTDIALHEVLIGIVIGAIVVAVGIFVSVMKFG